MSELDELCRKETENLRVVCEEQGIECHGISSGEAADDNNDTSNDHNISTNENIVESLIMRLGRREMGRCILFFSGISGIESLLVHKIYEHLVRMIGRRTDITTGTDNIDYSILIISTVKASGIFWPRLRLRNASREEKSWHNPILQGIYKSYGGTFEKTHGENKVCAFSIDNLYELNELCLEHCKQVISIDLMPTLSSLEGGKLRVVSCDEKGSDSYRRTESCLGKDLGGSCYDLYANNGLESSMSPAVLLGGIDRINLLGEFGIYHLPLMFATETIKNTKLENTKLENTKLENTKLVERLVLNLLADKYDYYFQSYAEDCLRLVEKLGRELKVSLATEKESHEKRV